MRKLVEGGISGDMLHRAAKSHFGYGLGDGRFYKIDIMLWIGIYRKDVF